MTDAIPSAYRVRLLFSASSILDVTDQVLAATWERSVASFAQGLQAGTADVVLANDQGSLSPLRMPTDLMRPNIGVTIEAAPTSGDAFRTVFTGFADSITVAPALSSPRNVVVSCRDRMKDLARRRIDTRIMTEINVGSLVTEVLDAGAITARSIDAIGDTIPFAWFRDRQVTTVVEEVIQAGGYAAYVAGDGTFRFRDRFFDLGGSVVASYAEFGALSWSIDESDVVNRVRVRGEPRTIVSSVQPVALLTEALPIPAGESIGFFLEFQDPRNQEPAPAIGIVSPVSSQDWRLNSQADGLGSDLTAQGSLVFSAFAETCVQTLTNVSSGTAYLTLYQVRGQPIQREAYLAITADKIASQSLYGIKDSTLETRLFGTKARLLSRATDILDIYGDPTPKVSLTLTNAWPDLVTIELADILYVAEQHAGIADQHTIQSMRHELNAEDRGWVHSATYQIERSKAVSPLILDSSSSGILDTNRLGRALA